MTSKSLSFFQAFQQPRSWGRGERDPGNEWERGWLFSRCQSQGFCFSHNSKLKLINSIGGHFADRVIEEVKQGKTFQGTGHNWDISTSECVEKHRPTLKTNTAEKPQGMRPENLDRYNFKMAYDKSYFAT